MVPKTNFFRRSHRLQIVNTKIIKHEIFCNFWLKHFFVQISSSGVTAKSSSENCYNSQNLKFSIYVCILIIWSVLPFLLIFTPLWGIVRTESRIFMWYPQCRIFLLYSLTGLLFRCEVFLAFYSLLIKENKDFLLHITIIRSRIMYTNIMKRYSVLYVRDDLWN